ncbi:MAG: LLM class flavin-dependent oxidoreductase [Betaproteobacteria bacterium]|nr:MAG: LLM class flavin-dependent oxidoreductase [Betaproteobacteria bacterium]
MRIFPAALPPAHEVTSRKCSSASSITWMRAAQRTKHLRLGPLVYTLPLYHPLRLAEEICTLDQLSGGRLELGVGRGVSPLEIASFGVDPAKSQAMYLEAYEVVIKALASHSVTFRGEHYSFDDTPFILEPVQKPHPPLWYGVFNAESTEWAAGAGVNVVTNLPAAAVRAITDRYREHWAKLGRNPGRIPFMGIRRTSPTPRTSTES